MSMAPFCFTLPDAGARETEQSADQPTPRVALESQSRRVPKVESEGDGRVDSAHRLDAAETDRR